MKFLPIRPEYELNNLENLQKEYASARDLTQVRVGETMLFLRSRLKTYYMPISVVTKAFRRVNLVDVKMACCGSSLPMDSVVVCGGDEEIVELQTGTERISNALLEELKQRCPDIEIGYSRPSDQATAVRSI